MPIKVRGLKELDRALSELPRRVAKKHLSGAVRKGAQLIAKDAKRRAPVSDAAFDFARMDSGKLQRNVIYFKRRARSTTNTVSYGVSVRSKGIFIGSDGNWHSKGAKEDPKNAYYWTFVEFGTRHQSARPFLRPAYEANKKRAVGVIARELGKRIQAEARKL
jgi:HK97 gp10 family phage protein